MSKYMRVGYVDVEDKTGPYTPPHCHAYLVFFLLPI